MVNDARPIFLCCTMSSLFRRKSSRLKRSRHPSEGETNPNISTTATPSTRPRVIVTQPSYKVDSNRRIFSLEELADRSSQTPHDITPRDVIPRDVIPRDVIPRDITQQEQADMQAEYNLLAGRQAVLQERVVRLERKLGKQELYCKQLTGLMRSDNRRLTKQIAKLHHKVNQCSFFSKVQFRTICVKCFSDSPSSLYYYY